MRADPPVLLSGDLIERFGEAISLVPTDATPVVFHSAVLNYVPVDTRLEFADLVQRHGDVVWLSNEAPGVMAELTTRLTPPRFASGAAFFVTARSGSDVIGISDPHGSWIRW